jgi:hypothetical protein
LTDSDLPPSPSPSPPSKATHQHQRRGGNREQHSEAKRPHTRPRADATHERRERAARSHVRVRRGGRHVAGRGRRQQWGPRTPGRRKSEEAAGPAASASAWTDGSGGGALEQGQAGGRAALTASHRTDTGRYCTPLYYAMRLSLSLKIPFRD